MHCGNALKTVMARKGCSGAELARKLGKHPQQISRWRNQKRFSITTILSLAEALEIDPQEFLR